MSNTDLFSEFQKEVESIIDLRSPDTFWECESVFLKINRRFINTWALEELDRYKNSVHYESREVSDYNVEICESKYFRLVITVLGRSSKYLYIHPQDYFGRNLGYRPIHYDRYELNKDVDCSVFDPTARLVFEKKGSIEPDETIRRQGLKQSLDYTAEDNSLGLLLRMLSPNTGAFEWAFDRKTLVPWGITSAEPSGSHLVSLLRIVKVAADQDSTDVVKKCAAHPFHNVRWAAVDTLCAIAPQHGLAVVDEMKDSDPHPEIRKSAMLTIQKYMEA